MKFYLIFRYLENKERNHTVPHSWRSEPLIFYGWTRSKDVALAFLQQRDPKKYRMRKLCDDEIEEFMDSAMYEQTTMIDTIALESNKFKRKIVLFMTQEEQKKAEQDIRNDFAQYSMFDEWEIDKRMPEIKHLVESILNLKPKYASALQYIGYKPDVIETMFDSVDNPYGDEESNDPPKEPVSHYHDVSKWTIFSFESFIRALRNDM